ncbi:MAG: hypothetical protein DMF62_02040 [Acidobacteria bacterium]|nr:MAG: hypothetical protein DMF62_02040 [Acidobacteriota bacterium]
MLLARTWWMFLIRGVLALIFGVVAILSPATAFISLVLIFGAFAFVDGVFALIAGITAKSENWLWLILEGVIGLFIGVVTLIQPAAMGEAWLILIAVWAIVTGIFEVVTAIRIRKLIEGEFWMILSGLISFAFGVLVLLNPMSGAVAVGFIIGIYAVMFGATLIALSLRLRRHAA